MSFFLVVNGLLQFYYGKLTNVSFYFSLFSSPKEHIHMLVRYLAYSGPYAAKDNILTT